MPNFNENTRDFLQFPIYYYDVVYSMSLPVRGIAGAASVLLNAWDPIALAPALLNVDASGNLKVTSTGGGSGGGTATAAAPTYVEGTNNALSMDLAGNLRVAGALALSGSVSVSNFPATQPVSGTVAVTSAGLTNLDVALSTRTKPSDQQHVIIDSSASIAVTGPLTDTQLRATPVPVSGTVVTGGLTDTQLRATPVPISGTVAAAVTGTVAVTGSVAVTGTFFQTTQPVSLASIPNEPNMDVALSTLAASLTTIAQASWIANKLNLHQLLAMQAGTAGFIPFETPAFLAG